MSRGVGRELHPTHLRIGFASATSRDIVRAPRAAAQARLPTHARGKMPQIDTVIFDVGNVLLDWNPRHLYRKLFSDHERMEWFLANVCSPAWNIEQDRGRSFADGIGLLLAHHPEWEREIRAYDERWEETVGGEISGSIALMKQLKGKVALYSITNFSREKYALSLECYAFLREFDGVVVSAHEGLLKPDPAIYRLFLERYRREASRCLFVDDSQRNVDGALAVGMHAVHFRGAAQLAADLARFGLIGHVHEEPQTPSA
jgi:2-haloacid dehalogenase